MRILLFTLAVCLASNALAQQPVTYHRAKVHLTEDSDKTFRTMGMDFEHGTYVPGKFYVSDLGSWEIEKLEKAGFTVDYLIEDVTTHYANQTASRTPLLACQLFEFGYPVPENFRLGSMGGYLTYAEMLDELDLMANLYPHLISKRAMVGSETTHQGREVQWVRISDNAVDNEDEPEVLYTGLHHAREPMSMMQMIYYMWYLLENYDNDDQVRYLVDNTEMYFIPCLNPDGYIYNEQIAPDGGGGWRKNMRDNNNDGVFNEKDDGVDLNRNYSYQWGHDDEGSSSDPSSVVYRGPEAFSEPETRVMKEFVEQHDFLLALNYHSFGNSLIYPWGFDGNVTPDSLRYTNYVEVLSRHTGFDVGTTNDVLGYLANGICTDWMYAEHNCFAATPELGHPDWGFWPAVERIYPMCGQSIEKNLTLAHLAHQFALATNASGDFFTSREGTLLVDVKRYGMGLGSLAMFVESISPDLVIESTVQEVGFDVFETENYEFSYRLLEDAEQGKSYSFVIAVDNGFFESRDTITKVFSTIERPLNDVGAAMDNWTLGPESSWGVTDEYALSDGNSLTDSPFSLYGPSEVNTMTLSEPIDLDSAIYADIEFDARWEIEDIIDYVIIEASSDGENFQPLCGRHSSPGSIFQAFGEPIYDGYQLDWVHEKIDLTDYLGGELYIRFTLVSDILFELDGFYVDNIRVNVYFEEEEISTSVVDIDKGQFLFEQYPNPASDRVVLQTDFTGIESNDIQITITDALGNRMFESVATGMNETTHIPIRDWPAGMYFTTIFIDGVPNHTERMVVLH